MRLLSILLVFIGLDLSGQDWKLIQQDHRYYFKKDSGNQIGNTIMAASMSIINGDTVYHLNPTVIDCFACTDTTYKLRNQPQFLGREIVVKSDSMYVFRDPGEFIIRPLERLNISWTFDSSNQIIASVDSIYASTTFGELDSLKGISLSNGGYIILSKNFGITHFDNTSAVFELVGVRNDTFSIGEVHPNFWDYYSFDIGDIIYKNESESTAGPGGGSTSTISKIEILSKQIVSYDPAEVRYNCNMSKRTIEMRRPPSGPNITWTVYEKVNEDLTFHEFQSAERFSNAQMNFVYQFETYGFALLQVNRVQSTYLKSLDSQKASYISKNPSSGTLNSSSDTLVPGPYHPAIKLEYRQGLAHKIVDGSGNPTTELEEYVGIITNGDTIGIIYPDSLVGIYDSTRRIYSQNWNPLSNTTLYHYSHNSTDIISHSIKVDSSKSSNGNLTYYLNPVVKPCKNCPDSTSILKNQPQFLLEQMVKDSSDNFTFGVDTSFVIKPYTRLDSSWLFDSLNNVIASVDSVYSTTTFGLYDSIKGIGLSNGGTVLLSKKFGILQFNYRSPSYKLIGIKTADTSLGEVLPSFWDYFDFEIGDTLCWSEYIFAAGPGGGSELTYNKGRVISKTVTDTIGEEVAYELIGYFNHSSDRRLPGGTGFYTDTIIDTISRTLSFKNFQPHITFLSNSLPNEVQRLQQSFYSFTEIEKTSSSYRKTVDMYNPYYSNNSDTLIAGSGYPGYRVTFNPGLAYHLIERKWTDIYYTNFDGRLRNGDTLGFIYPDSLFAIEDSAIGIQETSLEKSIRIYPNPSHSQLFIKKPVDVNIQQLTIYDNTGRPISKVKYSNDHIDVYDLENGVYFLRIEVNGESFIKKFLKN